ncbi:beta family protein [Vibrio alginolyticus]|uniref:beta family protein n=1 Tax=Vibrio alginolyticus TaxID=663 RepID=UPI001EEBDBC6|nr:beta family protein [Vibrio alginolyticus]MCG6316668.1 beta family protein [Vibrio alginolyticus]
MNINLESYKYLPILSLKPSEMAALEELSDKEKDQILPLIELKRWSTSKSIDKSYDRINKALSSRYLIADLDLDFINSIPDKIEDLEMEGKEIPDVFYEFSELSESKDGYKNWVSYINEYDNLIPVIQIQDLDEISDQLNSFEHLNRPIVFRLRMTGLHSINAKTLNFIVKTLIEKKIKNKMLIILDYGDLNRIDVLEYEKYAKLINQLVSFFPNAKFSVSGTSFPYSFTGSYRGEIPIYERQIFNKLLHECKDVDLIYSDRGSTRAESLTGSSGTPPPRIDYALKNDWRFIRKEFDKSDEDKYSNKDALYKEAAIELKSQDYWISDLPAWGRQMIEKTALGDPYGITSPQRATAVRINLHLHQQLHYFTEIDEIDTEDDWED